MKRLISGRNGKSPYNFLKEVANMYTLKISMTKSYLHVFSVMSHNSSHPILNACYVMNSEKPFI